MFNKFIRWSLGQVYKIIGGVKNNSNNNYKFKMTLVLSVVVAILLISIYRNTLLTVSVTNVLYYNSLDLFLFFYRFQDIFTTHF